MDSSMPYLTGLMQCFPATNVKIKIATRHAQNRKQKRKLLHTIMCVLHLVQYRTVEMCHQRCRLCADAKCGAGSIVAVLLSALDKQLNIQTYRSHEEIDIRQPLARHRWWERLRQVDSLHDTVLDSHDKTLLLIWASTHADSGQELPHVDVLAAVDGAGEDVWKGMLDGVEELVVCLKPLVG